MINRLKSEAALRGMSISTLAKVAGISKRKMYSRIESGDFRRSEMQAIGKALSVGKDKLFEIFFSDLQK